MTEPGQIDVHGQGVEQHVTGPRLRTASSRFDEAVRVAALGGDHVWVVIVSHHITDPAAFTEGGRHLDAENIVGAYLGCYRCEQPYDGRLLRRRCPGEPRG